MDLRRMRTHRMNHLLHPWLVLMHHLRKELFLSQVPLNPVYPICCLNKQPYVSPVPPFLALSGKSRSPSLLPDLRGKLFCLLSLSTMFAVSFPYMIFIMLRQFPPVPNFYHEWCQMLSIYYFFLSTEILVCVCVCVCFSLVPLMQCITLIYVLNHPCIPEVNPTQSWSIILLIQCGNQFANLLLRIFHQYS